VAAVPCDTDNVGAARHAAKAIIRIGEFMAFEVRVDRAELRTLSIGRHG